MKPDYKGLLAASAKRSGYQENGIAFLIQSYDYNAKKCGDTEAFNMLVKEYCNESVDVALAGEPIRLPDKSALEQTLEKFSNENRIGVDRNSQLERLRSHVQRMKENVKTLDCDIVLSKSELDSMPEHQRKALERAEQVRKAGYQVKIPAALQPQYGATAAYENNGLEVEVSITHAP